MDNQSRLHQRHSIRLKGYDYGQSGTYFITINTLQRVSLFGHIENGIVSLSETGRIVADEWTNTATIRKEISLDEWILMPNHLHGIVIIKRSEQFESHPDDSEPESPRTPYRKPRSLSSFLAGFKARTTSRVKNLSIADSIWQRNYYEHIIRSERSLNLIRLYIQLNPIMWEKGEDFDLSGLPVEEIDKRLARLIAKITIRAHAVRPYKGVAVNS